MPALNQLIIYKIKFIFLVLLLTLFTTVYPVNNKPVDQPYKIGYTNLKEKPKTSSDFNWNDYSKYNFGSNSPIRSPENPKPKDPPTYNPFSITFWNWYNSEEGQDWIRINGSPWGIISDPDPNWPSYVDDDYWNWFIENYPEYEEDAAQWFYDRGETPPWITPIGDIPIILLIVFCLAICYRIATKNKISSF